MMEAPMNAKQYREAIAKLALSQQAAATWLGIAPRTSQNYALGETRTPEPVAKLLRLVLARKIDPKAVA
jgi:hypothetical protein